MKKRNFLTRVEGFDEASAEGARTDAGRSFSPTVCSSDGILRGASEVPRRHLSGSETECRRGFAGGRESTKSSLKALRHAGRESRNEARGEALGEALGKAFDRLGNDPIDALPIVLDGSRRSSQIHRDRAEFDPSKFASKLSAHRFRRGSSAYRESLPKGVRVDCKKLPSSVEGFGVGPDCPTAKRNIRPDGDSCKRRFSAAIESKAAAGMPKTDRRCRQVLLQIFL